MTRAEESLRVAGCAQGVKNNTIIVHGNQGGAHRKDLLPGVDSSLGCGSSPNPSPFSGNGHQRRGAFGTHRAHLRQVFTHSALQAAPLKLLEKGVSKEALAGLLSPPPPPPAPQIPAIPHLALVWAEPEHTNVNLCILIFQLSLGEGSCY